MSDQTTVTEVIETISLDQITKELGVRYPGTLASFQRFSPGRVMTSLWACKRAFVSYHGVYPEDFLKRVYVLLEVQPSWKICHLFSGMVKKTFPDEVRVDLNPAVEAEFYEDAVHTHFDDGTFDLTLVDGPYDEENAKIYGYPYAHIKETILEASRITKVGGLYGIMHFVVPINWAKDKREAIIAITEGANMRIRGWYLFRKLPHEDTLALALERATQLRLQVPA